MDFLFSLLYILIAFVCPLLGLLLGAILPPFIRFKNKRLAISLNIGGFILYAPVATMLAAVFCSEPKAMSDRDILEGTALAITFFLATEVFSFLISRRRKPIAHPPCA